MPYYVNYLSTSNREFKLEQNVIFGKSKHIFVELVPEGKSLLH